MTTRQGLATALLLLLVFVIAGLYGGPANDIERSLMVSAAFLRSDVPSLANMAGGTTLLGGLPFTLGSAIIACLYLVLRKQWQAGLLLVSTVLVERLLVDAIKDWVGRPRPPLDHLPESLAYPSGHAANSMTAFLAVALIAVPSPYRRAAAAVAIALSLLVGSTRVIVGVHWPSDVIGGWALGLLAVGLSIAVGERSGALRVEAKHEVVGRHGPPPGKDEAA